MSNEDSLNVIAGCNRREKDERVGSALDDQLGFASSMSNLKWGETYFCVFFQFFTQLERTKIQMERDFNLASILHGSSFISDLYFRKPRC